MVIIWGKSQQETDRSLLCRMECA